MKAQRRLAMTLLIAAVIAAFAAAAARGQTMQMPPAPPGNNAPQQTMHHHGDIPPVKAEYPRMGRAQEQASGPLVTLEQLETIARQMNPTLRQAEAGIRAAKSRELQAGLYPNPTVGYAGDEIRGGSVGGGKQGFFVQQTVVTGGKLGLSRSVFSKETKLAETEAEEQKIRVESAVKLAFLRVLAAQELLDARQGLAKIAQDAADTQEGLMNTGQADETEVLQAQVEMHRMRMAARMQENSLREDWRSLAAVIGQPGLPMATVAGDLQRGWPELNEEQVLQTIAQNSPAVHIAEIAKTRAAGLFARARKEAVPDLQLRGGLEYNHETLGSVLFAKGWEGVAEVTVQLPIFNRNQGDVGAANAEVGRAEDERLRISLMLRERAASVIDQYANARLMAVEYREEIMPLAKKSYGLMVDKYGQMLASYPRVLETQKKLYELQAEYIATLETVWSNGIALQGYLLTDGLEGPARPGEMDRPVRETNVPLPERLPSAGGAMSRP